MRHLMTKVRGTFDQFSGEVTIADDPAASTAGAKIATASISTRNAQRDSHLRSAEILDTDTFPVMRFVTTQVLPHHGGYLVIGDLTTKDVTRR